MLGKKSSNNLPEPNDWYMGSVVQVDIFNKKFNSLSCLLGFQDRVQLSLV